MVQFIIDITGNMWCRYAQNNATATFRFGAWQKIATTSDIPTKLSQLTNDSGFANTASLEAEAKKWKDAYNNLRKRSVPAAFDDDELTALIDAPINSGDISLSQPYTDFDGLLIYCGSTGRNSVDSVYISSAEINRKIETTMSIGAQRFFLFSQQLFCTCIAGECTATKLPIADKNCDIIRIHGVKFKEIT